jgi:phage baseplate assembly protein gpV
MLNFNDLGSTGLSKDQVYSGVVVDNNDPRKLDRVRARVPLVFDGIDDQFLPWCIPTNNRDAGPRSGTCDIPSVGSSVRIRFAGGSVDHPEYSDYLVDESCVLVEKLTNYPNRKVRRFPNGTLIYLDVSTNMLYVEHPGPAQIKVGGDTSITVQGSLNVDASESLVFKCSNFQLDSGNAIINSNLRINGDTSIQGQMMNNGVNMGSTHVHRENDNGQLSNGPQ